MPSIKQTLFLALLPLVAGCEKYYISMHQQTIDQRYLASTHVGTPDPRQKNPPIGQMVVVEWHMPSEILEKKPYAEVYIVFWNYVEKKITFPIDSKWGYKSYTLLNDEYLKTGGILTYRAEVLTSDHKVYKEWKHQLWVNLIQVTDQETEEISLLEDQRTARSGEDKIESENRTSSSVVDQSMQGSVMETAYRREEGSSERS
jgi:hypothetical protein